MKTRWCVLLILVCWYGRIVACSAQQEDLPARVHQILESAYLLDAIDWDDTERRLLGLLDDESTSEDRGTVYLAIAKFYAGDSLNHYDKLARYAREALSTQIGVIEACQMYTCLGGAATAQVWDNETDLTGDQLASQAKPLLQGLAFVLSHLRIDTRQPRPRPHSYDIDPRSPMYKDAVRRREEEIAAIMEIDEQNRLLMYRDQFSRRVLHLFPGSEIDSSTFEQVVRDAVSDEGQAAKVLRYFRGGESRLIRLKVEATIDEVVREWAAAEGRHLPILKNLEQTLQRGQFACEA